MLLILQDTATLLRRLKDTWTLLQWLQDTSTLHKAVTRTTRYLDII